MSTITKLRERMLVLGWRDDGFDNDKDFLFILKYHQKNVYSFLHKEKLIEDNDIEQSLGFLVDLAVILKDIDN